MILVKCDRCGDLKRGDHGRVEVNPHRPCESTETSYAIDLCIKCIDELYDWWAHLHGTKDAVLKGYSS